MTWITARTVWEKLRTPARKLRSRPNRLLYSLLLQRKRARMQRQQRDLPSSSLQVSSAQSILILPVTLCQTIGILSLSIQSAWHLSKYIHHAAYLKADPESIPVGYCALQFSSSCSLELCELRRRRCSGSCCCEHRRGADKARAHAAFSTLKCRILHLMAAHCRSTLCSSESHSQGLRHLSCAAGGAGAAAAVSTGEVQKRPEGWVLPHETFPAEVVVSFPPLQQ